MSDDKNASVESAAVVGIDAVPVQVEVRISMGIPAIAMVGLPDAAVKESRDRVKSAVGSSGLPWPKGRITLNLAPGDLRKEGPAFDLPIALGLQQAWSYDDKQTRLDSRALERVICVGELGLDGTVRGVRGVLPIAIAARKRGRTLVCPRANAREALEVDGLEVRPVETLRQACGVLWEGARPAPPLPVAVSPERSESAGDYSDVQGQAPAIRSLLLAAAGGHNVLLLGPPGTGKTMLARRLPTILPPLTPDESLDVTAIYSVAGRLPGGGAVIRTRPFRSPHHSISGPGLVGGGTVPRPGEVSLAHHGVLFLDEMSEFPRHVLEELRQPVEDGHITVGRAAGTVEFPSALMLVGASNPCPCGFLGAPGDRCRCTPTMVERYRRRLSGPLLDRIDLHVEVPLLPPESLVRRTDPGTPSAELRTQVCAARDRQRERFAGLPGVNTNSQMGPRLVRRHCALSNAGRRALEDALRHLQLSARAYGRILKVARTIADVEGADGISDAAVFEAIQYRTLDRRIEV